jgi:hypothetical protein
MARDICLRSQLLSLCLGSSVSATSGVSGDGKSPEGIHAAAFPQPSPVGAVFGRAQFTWGMGVCRERPRETLLVAFLSEPPVIALHLTRTAGLAFL